VSSRPDPKFTAQVLSNAALLSSEGAGTTWAQAMSRMLDHYESAEGKTA